MVDPIRGEPIYAPDSAAQYLSDRGWRVASSYLAQLRSRKKGPKAIKVGGQVRYTQSALDEHLASIFKAA
jgi:hypothetical protein